MSMRLLPWIGQTFEIRWSSTQAQQGDGALRRRCFVLHIELLSQDQAAIAAWIESAHGQEFVLDRRTATALTELENGLLHIDVLEHEGNARMASLSIIASQSLQSARVLYARTELLAKAGFAVGSCDPPVLHRRDCESLSESA